MKKRVLVIDDDRLVLESLASLLIKDGWNVDICRDGLDGLKYIENRTYDCILLDIRMPGLSGTDVLERLRKLEEQQKIIKQNVIMMTGYADESASVKAFELGAFNYIQKPFDIQTLLKKANSCISAARVVEAFEAIPEDKEESLKKIRKFYDADSIRKKDDLLAQHLGISLRHIRGCTYDTSYFKGNIENPIGIIQIPLGFSGPVSVKGSHANGEFWVPMATTEGALLLTYDLGMRLLKLAGPVEVEILNKNVHISPMFPIQEDEDKRVSEFIDQNYDNIKKIAESDSSHTKLLKIERKRIAKNFCLKFIYDTSDAHGLNMINHATFNACKYIEAKTGAFFYLRSHYSGVKHHSLLNEHEGYGRSVKARGIVTSKALAMLHVSAKEMKDFFDRCIECGHAAGIESVNVHAANAIAAIFLACGQDVADISSSHVCETTTQVTSNGKDILIQVHLKNLLVATVGGGTGLGTQKECLEIIGCYGSGKSDKFAEIIAATVLAGEFPTAAAVINRSYVDIHDKYGRNKNKLVPS